MQVSAEKIVVLGTGGTIAGRAQSASDGVGYTAAQVAVGELLQGVVVPAGFEIVHEQVAQLDSKDMTHAVWHALAGRCAHWLAEPHVRGIVVTHGTDTMEETAYFLQAVLAPRRPVVLTGAMRPASAAVPDGPQNLADALAVAAAPQVSGVCVVFAGAIHGAEDVAKRHPYRLDAFSSGDAGVIGYVEEFRVRQLRPWPETAPAVGRPLPAPDAWPRVDIVTSHAGASGHVVQALVAAGAQGIVVAATGNGTVHGALATALADAQARGVAVRLATRCPEGRIVGEGAPGIATSGARTPVQARIALMLELMR